MTDYAETILLSVGNGQSGHPALEKNRPVSFVRSAAFQRQLRHRALDPGDLFPLRLLHQRLLPIDYDDQFFQRAVNSIEMFTQAAVLQHHPHPCRSSPGYYSSSAAAIVVSSSSPSSLVLGAAGGSLDSCGQLGGACPVAEQLVGVITAKPFPLHQIDAGDRSLLGFTSPALDHQQVVYILTLGVEEEFRGAGIASRLVSAVQQYASQLGCLGVYLHVISYNTSAMAFYQSLGFREVAILPNFYTIRTGRQINPHQQVYDASLFVLPLTTSLHHPRLLHPDSLHSQHASTLHPPTPAAVGPRASSRGVVQAVSQLTALLPPRGHQQRAIPPGAQQGCSTVEGDGGGTDDAAGAAAGQAPPLREGGCRGAAHGGWGAQAGSEGGRMANGMDKHQGRPSVWLKSLFARK